VSRIGLLGGTFDPPHIGHLWLAQTAREQLQLDQILFLPVAQPPHKQGRWITAVHHRLHMTQLAIANDPQFALDTTDSDRPPPQVTVTLIPLLKAKYPQAQFWLLIGADSLRDLPDWHEPHKLIQQCRLAVLPRPGVMVDWEGLCQKVMEVNTAVDPLDGPTLDISSTDIRQWAEKGYSIRHLVPTAVRHYIQQHSLYTP